MAARCGPTASPTPATPTPPTRTPGWPPAPPAPLPPLFTPSSAAWRWRKHGAPKRDGRVVEANDRARALLRHGDGLSDRDGVLSTRVPADRARLVRLVAGALPTSGAVAVSGSMLLHRTSTRPPFVVHVRPVRVRQLDFGARYVAALVLITEPGHESRIAPALVAKTLGLTPVESQMAVWLAEGQTVREIAGATGRTAGSVYWHLNHIYRKQGLSRQADLVRRVLSVATFV